MQQQFKEHPATKIITLLQGLQVQVPYRSAFACKREWGMERSPKLRTVRCKLFFSGQIRVSLCIDADRSDPRLSLKLSDIYYVHAILEIVDQLAT